MKTFEGSISFGKRCLALIPRADLSIQTEELSFQSMPCDNFDYRQFWKVRYL